jgi:hypothetical protein
MVKLIISKCKLKKWVIELKGNLLVSTENFIDSNVLALCLISDIQEVTNIR